MDNDGYRPLPDYLTIRKSKIEGLGLFASHIIDKDTDIGICHILHESFQDGVIRTPIGGFINHSNNPNCIKLPFDLDNTTTVYILKTIKTINQDEELTLSYTLREKFPS